MLNRITAVACGALLASACGPPGVNPKEGHVRVSVTKQALSGTGGTQPICGTISLQPYSLTNGTMALAGDPVTLQSSQAAVTDQILGCIDNGERGNANWGYLVTAASWNDCLGTVAPHLVSAQPQVFTGNYPVGCVKGVDSALPIAISVSIATANNVGYIDISVEVDSKPVQTGCKDADYATVNGVSMLHFGEAYVDPGHTGVNGVSHQGVLGLSGFTAAPKQYAGTITPDSGQTVDTYFTGQAPFTLGSSTLLYQTFLNKPCAQQYVDSTHAQCVTTTTDVTPYVHTTPQLADLFFVDPAWGFATASIGSSTYYPGGGAPPNVNPGGALSILWHQPSTNEMAVPAPGVAYPGGVNAVVQSYVSAFTNNATAAGGSATALWTFTGVYLDPSHTHRMLVTGITGGASPAPGYSTLTLIGTTWTLGPALALPANPAALGLFVSTVSSCIAPIP